MQVIRKIPFENVQVGDEIFDNNCEKKFKKVIKITKDKEYIKLHVIEYTSTKAVLKMHYKGLLQDAITVRINVK